MIVAGIDYSLCGPAVCLFKSNATGKFSYSGCSFFFLTENKRQSEIRCMNVFGERLSDWNSDEHRYETIADWAVDIVMAAPMWLLKAMRTPLVAECFRLRRTQAS
jgi:hypothetical protein